MAEFEDRKYEISSVISRSFETVTSNLLLFAGLALVLSGVPAFAFTVWQLSYTVAVDPAAPPNFESTFSTANIIIFLAGLLVTIVTGAVLQAALTRATVQYLSDEKPDFGRSLSVGLAMALPMIAIGILLWLGVALASCLLIIPGIILWQVWSVTVPAYVQEKIGIFEAFGRSAALTRGFRWRIFLTLLIVAVGLWLLSIPINLFTVGLATAGSVIPVALVQSVISALSSMLMLAVQACIYVELRDVKEGVAPADLEAIFA